MIVKQRKKSFIFFQLTHFNHAVELFKEMINCALEATNRPQIRVLLCCSGGLTTTLFASKMQELAKLENYHMRFLQQDIHAYLRLLMIMILF